MKAKSNIFEGKKLFRNAGLATGALHAALIIVPVFFLLLTWSSNAFCGNFDEAIRKNDVAKVKALLRADPGLATVKAWGDTTALHLAALEGRKEITEVLLAYKADVNAKSFDGSTPLSDAASRGYKDVVEVLLNNKAEVNVKNMFEFTPLHLAVLSGNTEVVALLLEQSGYSRGRWKRVDPFASCRQQGR